MMFLDVGTDRKLETSEAWQIIGTGPKVHQSADQTASKVGWLSSRHRAEPAVQIMTNLYYAAACQTSFECPATRDGIGERVKRGTVTTEKWTYDRGPSSFAMVVTIEDGKIKSMERAK